MRAMQACGVQALESVDHPEVTQSSSEEDPFVCKHPLTSGVSLGPVFSRPTANLRFLDLFA